MEKTFIVDIGKAEGRVQAERGQLTKPDLKKRDGRGAKGCSGQATAAKMAKLWRNKDWGS